MDNNLESQSMTESNNPLQNQVNVHVIPNNVNNITPDNSPIINSNINASNPSVTIDPSVSQQNVNTDNKKEINKQTILEVNESTVKVNENGN